MKKIMILLLSLAVLFGFAACDNSNSTPDEPETPATGNELNAQQIQSAANAIYGLLKADKGIAGIGGTSGAFNGATTLSGDYAAPSTTSYTYTWEDQADAALQGDTTATLTLSAQANATGASATNLSVVFDRYTLEFSTSILDNYSGNYVTVAGTVSGALVGTGAVTLANGTATAVNPTWDTTNGYFILPDTATVTWNGESIDPEDLIACIAKPTDGTNPVSTAGYVTEKDYLDKVASTAESQIGEVVALMFNASADTNTLAAVLASYVDGNVGTTGYTVGGNTAATAYIEYDVPTNNEVATVVSDATDGSIRLAPGSKFRVDFEAAAPVASGSPNFTATKFTLSGDFIVSGVASPAAFTKVSVEGLEGTLTGCTVTGNNTDGITSLASVTFATSGYTDGIVTATDVTTAAGPEITKNASNDWVRKALGEASVEYPTV